MDINYSFASSEDMPILVDIWRECFGDSEEYINNFISRGAAEEFAVSRYGGEIIGMTALIPCSCGSCNAYYVYALCVLPQYRKRGVARGLLDFAFTCSKERFNGGLILHPAEESLYGYYRSLGFDVPLWGQTGRLTSEALKEGRLLSCEEFISEREKIAHKCDMVSFRSSWVSLNYHDTLGDGGFCVSIGDDYFFGKKKEGVASLVETSASVDITEAPVGLGRGIPVNKKYILTLMGE